MIVIAPHQTVKVGTGLAMELPHGYFGAIYARSGLATKQGLRPANCVGVVDEDYRGEFIVALHNDTDMPQMINPMERIAQLVVMPYLSVSFNEVDDLSKTERGEDGFGSTGK
jgi:dUTP pyrophosphatase